MSVHKTLHFKGNVLLVIIRNVAIIYWAYVLSTEQDAKYDRYQPHISDEKTEA